MSLHKWISKVLPVLLVSGGLAVAQELPDEEQILYIPQVVHGGGLETEFNMINLSESNRRVEIRTFGADGNPANLLRREASASATSARDEELAPLGVASIFSFSSSPSEVATGWAEITTTGSIALEVVFSARGPEGLLTSTSVLPTEASTAFSVIAFATQTLQTGLALLNPPSNAQTATVTVELVGSLGDVDSSVELSVPPGQTIPPQYVGELFSRGSGPGVFWITGYQLLSARGGDAGTSGRGSFYHPAGSPGAHHQRGCLVRASDHGRQQHEVDTETQRRYARWGPNRQPPVSGRPRRESFRRPASLQRADRQQASPCSPSLLGHRRLHHQDETSES